MAWPLKPVVLCFPDHSSGVSRQDQVGARKPSTSTVCSRAAASFASSTVGLSSSVDASISGVNFVMIPEITGWGRIEYFGPDFLGYVLSHIPACHNDGFSQGKVLRPPDSFVPGLFKLILDAPFQFVELLCVKA
jgi:hypothetical protein